MPNLVDKTENIGPDITDSLPITCKDNYKVEDIKLNKENRDKEDAGTSQKVIENIKETKIIKENGSELAAITENYSELVLIKKKLPNLPVIKENSFESAVTNENGSESSVVMDEFVGTENTASELDEVKESDLDVVHIIKSAPELMLAEENIEILPMAEENSSKVLAIKEGDVNDSLLLKVDLCPDIVNMQHDSESQNAFSHGMSQSEQQQGPSHLNQDICWTHSEELNTQSENSTLRKLLTTNDWSTLRHRYDISDFSSQYGNSLSKNYRKNDVNLNENSNTTKKNTQIKYVVKKKRNKNDKYLTAYKEKYITEAKKSHINVERKKTIAFLNHYNFHTNKQNCAEKNKLDTNISDINCNFSTYEEKSINKDKLYTDVSDTICNLQIFGKNDESSYVSDIYHLHINQQNSIETGKLHTNVLHPFYNLETNEPNGFDNNKLNAEISDVNYNFHTNKLNCTAKTKAYTAISTDTVEKLSHAASETINKMTDVESHLLSYEMKDIYKCISCDDTTKCSASNRHISHTSSEFGSNKCKHCMKGRLSNHTRTHSVHKSYTREGCDCKGKKKILTNHKTFKCTCGYKNKRHRDCFLKPKIHIEGGYCSCEFCYQSTQLGSVNDLTTHTRGKSFSCDLCEYKCGTKLHLVNYVKTLSGENVIEEIANSRE